MPCARICGKGTFLIQLAVFGSQLAVSVSSFQFALQCSINYVKKIKSFRPISTSTSYFSPPTSHHLPFTSYLLPLTSYLAHSNLKSNTTTPVSAY